MEREIQRVVILFSRLSGYMSACLKTLKERHHVELLVVRWPSAENAPFDEGSLDWIDALHSKKNKSASSLQTLVDAFDPQALYIPGWMDKDYLRVARTFRKRGGIVVAGMDTQWTGTLRQQIGRLISPWYLKPTADILWAAGERQRQTARKLGYAGMNCWSGYYSCDWPRFSEVYVQRQVDLPPAFLYVGRYIRRKGIDTLVQAYRQYRDRVDHPWPLICVGAGDQQHLLCGQEGIEDRGFVQPDRLPALLGEAAAFVLPSRKEPWGVVVHEAAASGLPVLCSDACGAAVHLLQDGYNGFLFETGNAEHLAQGMVQLTEASQEERAEMGRGSYELSKQFTPQRWADTFIHGIAALRRQR